MEVNLSSVDMLFLLNLYERIPGNPKTRAYLWKIIERCEAASVKFKNEAVDAEFTGD